MRLILPFLLLAGLLPFSAGCTPVGVLVGAGAVAGSTALEERGMQQSLTDTGTALSFRRDVIEEDFETFQRVGVIVVEGRMLLTGVVPEEQDRIRLVERAWSRPDVVEVINEILIGEDVGILNTGYDVKIEQELNLALTLDREIKAVNYESDAVGGTLYLIGIAQSQAELDRVVAHARDVERVRRVISHVQVKDSPARRETLERLAEIQAAEDGSETQ